MQWAADGKLRVQVLGVLQIDPDVAHAFIIMICPCMLVIFMMWNTRPGQVQNTAVFMYE
jgi:hypothetical protein